jgi:hypothetical protein
MAIAISPFGWQRICKLILAKEDVLTVSRAAPPSILAEILALGPSCVCPMLQLKRESSL